MSTSILAFVDHTLLTSPGIDHVLLKNTMERISALTHRADILVEGRDATSIARAQGHGAVHFAPQLPETVRDPISMLSSRISTTGALLSSIQWRSVTPMVQPALEHPPPLDLHPSAAIEPLPNIRYNNLWGMPENTSTDGKSAIPYILAGRDSFSSFLYFETIAMVSRALHGETSDEVLNSVLRYKRLYATFAQVLDVVNEVMNMMLHGTSQNPRANTRALATSLSALPDRSYVKISIANEIASASTPEADYLSTWEVERYLQDHWGLLINSQSIRIPARSLLETRPHTATFPVSPTQFYPFALNNFLDFSPQSQSVFQAGLLVEKLKVGAVSLGEGPRWHTGSIDDAVKSFLREMRISMEIST